MLIITKENNSIKVVGQNNPTYPYSGTLVYPLNSVTVVTDQSDMAVFRSALNNDVLFTGLIENITIAGSPVTKEDIGTKFGAIANSSGSGGGGTGGAVDSVNGQTGTVVLTAADVNAYSKAETDEKLRDYTPLEAYATEIASIKKNMGNKADKSSLDNYLLKTDAQSTYETISGAQGKYQAKLTAGTGIEITGENVINVTLDTNIYQVVEALPEDSINPNKIYLVLSAESGESDLYIEYLYVNNKWEKIGEYKADVDLTPYLTKADAASTYQPKGEYVTDTELEGKGYALNTSLEAEVTERQKQDSALGGMIAGETQAREQAINNLTATVQGKLDTATYNQEKAGFETTEHAEATYQPKGSYLTSIPDEYVTDTELTEKGYATEAWVTEQGYLTEHQDISGLATKEELNGKQNTLVSGTNIKTINSQSLLGSGDITIEGGSGSGVKEWDFAQLQSDNEYRNNFIANAKASDIVNNVSYQSIAYDHCSILCIKGSTYTLLLNITSNPMIAPLTVVENNALISSAINIYTIVDSTLSDDSTNPVQNKVIKAELDKMASAKNHDLSTYGGAINAGDTLTNVGNYALPKTFVAIYSDMLNVIAVGLNADGNDIVINLKNENVEGNWKWNVKSEIEIGGGTSGSGIATWDYAQIQSDQEYRTNFLSNVKVSDDLTNLGGSDNPEHASILTIDGNVYTVMYNVGGNPKVASINIQESVATITNIDAIIKNVATTTENGLMSSADKTKLDSIDVESILSRITALETQMGEVSAKLDTINGETV